MEKQQKIFKLLFSPLFSYICFNICNVFFADMADKDLEARKEKEEKKLVDDADDENDDSRDGLGDEF